MNSNNKGGKIVYIGGIPFDFSEFDVLNIANTVGTVIGIKLVFDQLTGKSKGYAFVEYSDENTAASAVRNLNNYQVGNRYLKCGFSSGSTISGNVTIVNPDGTLDDGSAKNSMANNGVGGYGKFNSAGNAGIGGLKNQQRKKRRLNNVIPPLPPGVTVGENETVFDMVSRTLKSLEQIRLFNIIKDAKGMALKNPEVMVELLDQCPQLSSALIEILLLFQLKSPEDVSALLSSEVNLANSEPSGTATERDTATSTTQEQQQQKEEPVGQKVAQPKEEGESNKTEAAIISDPQQLEAIKQVILLTPEQIQLLPEDQKEAIIQIQENYKKGHYGAL